MILKKLFTALVIILAVQVISCRHEKVTISTSLHNVVSGPGRTLWWVYRDGREEAIKAPPAAYSFPKISPDGTKIAVTVQIRENWDIWILDLTQDTFLRFTSGEAHENQPLWSPDGKRIAFSTSVVGGGIFPNTGISGIEWKNANGKGKAKALGAIRDKWIFPFSWSRDGKTLLTSESGPDFQNVDIGLISVGKGRPYNLLLKETYHELHPQLSPDGRWLAYATNDLKAQFTRVFVSPYPDVGKGKWQVSALRGDSPRWSPNGKELYYLVGNNIANVMADNIADPVMADNIADAVMVVGIETQPAFRPGKAKVLFRGRYLGALPNNGIPYDVHPDGQRFLMIKP